MEVLKYKYSYYVDSIHLYGHVILDVYCVPDFVEKGKHFQISIGNENKMTEIKMLVVDSLPADQHNRHSTKTYDIATVTVDKQWIEDCYKTYLAEFEIANTKLELIKSKPAVKSKFDMFDEYANMVTHKFKTGCYEDAINVATKCVEEYSDNPKISTIMYNCACCWAKLDNELNLFTWLNLAQKNNYNNWSYMIVDKDFSKVKNTKEFVEIVKTMILVNPEMNYGSREIIGYLETHDLYKLQNTTLCAKNKLREDIY
jgi:hypothetical protein